MSASKKQPSNASAVKATSMYEYKLRRIKRKLSAPVGEAALHPFAVASVVRRNLINDGQEHFFVFLLNSKLVIVGFQIVSIGGGNGVLVMPCDVFRAAVLDGASAIIVAHNHPSGDPSPSIDDVLLTDRIGEAGLILGIPLVDHIIVTDNDYHSMGENSDSKLIGQKTAAETALLAQGKLSARIDKP